MRYTYMHDLVDSVVLMCQQVTGKTCTIIPPATPAEETFQTKLATLVRTDISFKLIGCHIIHIFLNTLRITLELLPINRIRIRAFDNIIYPSTIWRVTVRTNLDQVNRA